MVLLMEGVGCAQKKYLYDPETSSSINLPVLLHFYLLEIQFLCL